MVFPWLKSNNLCKMISLVSCHGALAQRWVSKRKDEKEEAAHLFF